MAECEIISDCTPLLDKKERSSLSSAGRGYGFLDDADEQPSALDFTSKFICGYCGVGKNRDDCGCSATTEFDSCLTDEGLFCDIVCIFVVAFDTRAGNVVEWQLPRDCCIDGIEFKAMASGSHRVQTDFIYFKRGPLYGLSCFENMPVDSTAERGARMKSVGILATSFTSLHIHMDFLQGQVRLLLENPGSYEELETYYEKHKRWTPTGGSVGHPHPPCFIKQSAFGMPLMKITHPAGCFSQFMNFFAEKIFLLWKLALLKKRIIFFSPPPIGVVCYRAYSTTCLTAHGLLSELDCWSSQPLFYINIADMETLEDERNYIACTTEKIFESKSGLYDLYVDNQNFIAQVPLLKKMMSVGPADKMKFSQLCQLQSQIRSRRSGSSTENVDEVWFIRFFMSLNEHLFTTLLEVSHTPEKLWTEEHMRSVGLDPVNDRTFIMELADTYGIDIVLMVDNLCCPASHC